MDYFVDISTKLDPGTFTKKAKPFGLKTQILMKVPKFGLTAVRITGPLTQITDFLRTQFDLETTVQMHVNAAKVATEDNAAPLAKNRTLAENRRL